MGGEGTGLRWAKGTDFQLQVSPGDVQHEEYS